MGYSTEFRGQLKFRDELTARQLAKIKSMCGEDCRDHQEWEAGDLTYIDLQLTDDFSGLEWSGAEKTYYMEKLVNVIITQMRKTWPEFALTGELQAQGEDAEDRWKVIIGDDGMAKKVDIVVTGEIIACPRCGGRFVVEDTLKD